MGAYLEDTIQIDWQTPSVFEKATALAAGRETPVERIRALFEFVRDEIPHSFDIGADSVPCRASEVLSAGSGLCYAKSHLLVALLRAIGIPAGFGYQRLRKDPPQTGHVLHGFTGVFLAERHRWIALDPRGNNAIVTTEFSLDEPSLAFHPDPELGEHTYEWVYARPSRRVIDVLDRIDSLAIARQHLPGEV